jgi:hypothetical protein
LSLITVLCRIDCTDPLRLRNRRSSVLGSYQRIDWDTSTVRIFAFLPCHGAQAKYQVMLPSQETFKGTALTRRLAAWKSAEQLLQPGRTTCYQWSAQHLPGAMKKCVTRAPSVSLPVQHRSFRRTWRRTWLRNSDEMWMTLTASSTPGVVRALRLHIPTATVFSDRSYLILYRTYKLHPGVCGYDVIGNRR